MRRLIAIFACFTCCTFFTFLAACGGGSNQSPDAGLPADAPDVPSQTVQFSGCGVTDAARFTLPAVRVGQVVSYTFPFSPSQSRLTPSASSSDPELAASVDLGSGRLVVKLTPTTPGHREIKVTVTVTDLRPLTTAVGTLTIEVDVLPASTSPLVASTPLITPQPFMDTIVLKNQSTSTPVELLGTTSTTDDGTPPGGGANLSRCPRTLQPGDSCLVQITSPSRSLGCHRSAVRFHSSANEETVYVDSPREEIQVDLSSPLGTITASPPGSCNATACFTSPVTLTAIPNAGSRFVGWPLDFGCGAEPTCVFRPYARQTPLTIFGASPRFVPATTKTITLTVQGTGKGRVLFYEQDGSPVACEGSCTYASPGEVRLVAAASSRFTGWTGACSGTLPQCNLGVLTGDLVVGATFAPDDREQAVFTPPPLDLASGTGAAGGGVLPGGDLVIAAASRISRVTPAGSLVWTRASSVSELVTSPGGDIYYLSPSPVGSPTLYKLDPAGAVVWSRTLYQPQGGALCGSGKRLAVTASGDLAVQSDQTLRVVAAATGADVWTAPTAVCAVVAAGPGGGVVAAVGDPADPNGLAIQRYDAAGARQLPDWTLGGGRSVELAFDPQGFLAARSRNESTEVATLRRLTPAGATVFSISEPSGSPSALTVASNGEIVTADALADGGTRLRRWSPAGAVTWTLDKPAYTSTLALEIGVTVTRLAADGAGRVLALGSQRLAATASPARFFDIPWAALYAGP